MKKKMQQVDGFWSKTKDGKKYWNDGFKRRYNPNSIPARRYNIKKDNLEKMYCIENKNSREISEIIGCSQSLILYKLRKFRITKPLNQNEFYWQGKKRSEKTKKLISKSRIGKSCNSDRYNWVGGCKDWRGSNWEESRIKTLNRDIVCQECGGDDNLHVHHKVPFREFDNYTEANNMNNLIALCSSCHIKEDHKYRSKVVVFNVSSE